MAQGEAGQQGQPDHTLVEETTTSTESLSDSDRLDDDLKKKKSDISRSSSVRFASGTSKQRQSDPMGRRRASHDSDEIRPIRTANQQSSRTYNTTERSSSEEQSTHETTPVARVPKRTATEDNVKPSWWKRTAEKYGSITLDNKGSVARDHLALERTFLAWLRTSLAFASIGIAITQLFRLNTTIQNRQKRSVQTQQSQLPLSPLVGHGLPYEVVPLLQQLALSAGAAVQPVQIRRPGASVSPRIVSRAAWSWGSTTKFDPRRNQGCFR